MYKAPVTLFQREGEAFKRTLLRQTLDRHPNVTAAAQALGLTRSYLQKLIKDFRVREFPHA